ncbi:X-linked interleukin-1 receptor accessory protein-like 2 isoform X2 [Lytechinus pictus]|uniref:X-linked interleukin-1 receptor accessory protein-like 2 isoform X2 n=1 Tax=Lytechinus pictus TaxID=7653 RepID=UPI0030B9D655
MPKTKMTCSRGAYSWAYFLTRSWTYSWSRKVLGLLLMLCLVRNSSQCPERKTNSSSLEIGDVGESKDIICQVKEECKVAWLKEGIPLPLEEGGDIFCDIECNCRALIFKSLTLEDAGIYTCQGVEGCGGDNLPQSYHLRVDIDEEPKPPIITYNEECQDKIAYPGEDVTFCCICQVGATSESTFAYWLNMDDMVPDDEEAEKRVSYDPEEELASCITLHNVNQSAAGNYTLYCSTSEANSFNTLVLEVKSRWWIPVISGLVAFVIVTILIGIIYRINRVEIRLLLKDQFGKQEKDDGRLYDAYISYYWSDSESSENPDRIYAFDLKKRLTKLGYNVCLAETDFIPGNETSEEIVESLTRSRRYIILLSPQFLTYRYVSLETEQCLDIIKQHKKEIIPIFIRQISPDVIKSYVALDHIISTHPRLDWQIFEDTRSLEAPVRTHSMDNGNAIELEASATIREAPKLRRAERHVWRMLRLQMPPIPRQRSSPTEQPLLSEERDSWIEDLQDDSVPRRKPEMRRSPCVV